MSVLGGWSGWNRAHARAARALLIALTLAVGCGGRTSALDSSVYDGSVDVVSGSGGGGKAGAAMGGKPAAGGVGGRAPTPTAGKPATGGSGGSVIGGNPGVGAQPSAGSAGTGGAISGEEIATCKEYCSSYGFICGADVGGCTLDCQHELASVSFDCRKLGASAFGCVAENFEITGVTCAAGTDIAVARCGRSLDLFEACKGAPIVTPVPRGSDTDVSTCAGSLTANSVSCKAVFECDDGDYNVYCGFGAPSMVADCSCVDPLGRAHEAVLMDDGKPCYLAARLLCR